MDRLKNLKERVKHKVQRTKDLLNSDIVLSGDNKVNPYTAEQWITMRLESKVGLTNLKEISIDKVLLSEVITKLREFVDKNIDAMTNNMDRRDLDADIKEKIYFLIDTLSQQWESADPETIESDLNNLKEIVTSFDVAVTSLTYQIDQATEGFKGDAKQERKQEAIKLIYGRVFQKIVLFIDTEHPELKDQARLPAPE